LIADIGVGDLDSIEDQVGAAGQGCRVLQADYRRGGDIGRGDDVANDGDDVGEIVSTGVVPLGAGHDVGIGDDGAVGVLHGEEAELALGIGGLAGGSGIPGIELVFTVADLVVNFVDFDVGDE